ncbi:alpha/beta hydrolase [Pseudaestuariivita sp.]|uniref:alpha/beta hydrolase n=1 Tax=Pseudaestuariivita sp. TaxID=2211669 RepID=UPI004058D0A6
MGKLTPEILFDGRHLRVTVFNPGQRKLFTSFRQRVPNPGSFTDAQPVRSFTDRNFTHLHIQSLQNDWYINEDTVEMEAAIDAFTAQFRKSIAMGFSMGGYGALRFAKALRLTDGLYVSASSVPPFHAEFDPRYQPDAPDWIRELSLLETHGKRDLVGVYAYDPFRRRDLLHSKRMEHLQPSVTHARLCGGGHPATQAINGAGEFSLLQGWLRRRKLTGQNVANLHRECRRQAPVYWRHMAEVAERRGRTEFAKASSALYETLSALKDNGK